LPQKAHCPLGLVLADNLNGGGTMTGMASLVLATAAIVV
jgi:hypothetical protein